MPSTSKTGLAMMLALVLLANAGCGTIYNLGVSRGGPTIYGGIDRDIELLGTEGDDQGIGLFFVPFDFVLSLVLDTATLPITALCSCFGWQRARSLR